MAEFSPSRKPSSCSPRTLKSGKSAARAPASRGLFASSSMEWTKPRSQPQFAYPLQPQLWYNQYDDVNEEDKQEATLGVDRHGCIHASQPPRSPLPRKSELPSTPAYNGMAFQSLGLPQVEEATEFQPLYSLQSGSFFDGTTLPALPPQSQQEGSLSLPQQQFGMQVPAQFASQYSELPVEPTSQYLRPLPTLSSSTMQMPFSSTRPPVNYFHEGISTPHIARSSVPTLPANFASLEQQQHFLPPSLLEYQEGDFDNDIAQEISSSMFHASAMSAELSERERQNSCPARPNLSVSGTPPTCLSAVAPLSRPKREGALREPFTAMAVTDKPKFSPDKRKLCCVEGCLSQARAFNRCKRHGGSKRCSSPGCTKSVQSRGLCIRHGGGSRCQESGCTRASQSHGRCKLHGGGRPCIVAGCDKKAHLKRLCRKHGGGIKCRVANCEKWSQRQGMCMTHSKVAGGPQSSGIGTIGELDHFGQNALSLPASSASSSPLSLSTFSDAA